ncbi:hypothetical protein RF11_05693 [Thelohanellus kitauei]|uniref:Uncharacterized protein n=1 Tax=Thelohanellus kitauei TaxID=669202 RepID=A0A0C2NAD8_THEKT|nr:hypothetical protein RF11_05693 [Thelohanellus kitauei]
MDQADKDLVDLLQNYFIENQEILKCITQCYYIDSKTKTLNPCLLFATTKQIYVLLVKKKSDNISCVLRVKHKINLDSVKKVSLKFGGYVCVGLIGNFTNVICNNDFIQGEDQKFYV